jgi:hypothetical protein
MRHDTGCPEDGQLLRDRSLGHTKALSHVFDVALLVHQPGHQLQPHRMAESLERLCEPFGSGPVYAACHIYL